jgi:hypothetical protein
MALSPQQFGGGFQKAPSGHPQQGTLFRAPKPRDEDRYPRGYTPERMAATRGALAVEPSSPGRQPFSGPLGTARLHEAVARSTVPLDEIAPVYHGADSQMNPVDYPNPVSIKIASAGRGATGSYSHVGGTLSGHVTLAPTSYDRSLPDAESTLFHELGHRASHMAGTEHSYLGSPADLGKEEAFADDYRTMHRVPDKRAGIAKESAGYSGYESMQTGRDNPWTAYAKGMFPHHTRPGFTARKAYNEARTTKLGRTESAERFHASEAAYRRSKGIGPSGEFQIPLWHQVGSRGQEEDVVHNQHAANPNPDPDAGYAPLSKIKLPHRRGT